MQKQAAKPSNFLGRSKRSKRQQDSQPVSGITKLHTDDRLMFEFQLPDGRHAIAAGPTAEKVMKTMEENYPGAELLSALS